MAGAGLVAGAAGGGAAGAGAGAGGAAGTGLGAGAEATGAEAAANPVAPAATPTPSPTPASSSGTKPEPNVTKPAAQKETTSPTTTQGSTAQRDFSPPKPRPDQGVQGSKDEEKEEEKSIADALKKMQDAVKDAKDESKKKDPNKSLIKESLENFEKVYDLTFPKGQDKEKIEEKNQALGEAIGTLKDTVASKASLSKDDRDQIQKTLGKLEKEKDLNDENKSEISMMQKNCARIIPFPMKDIKPDAIVKRLENVDQIKQVGKFVAGVGGDAPKLSGAQAENAVKFKASPLGKDAKDEDIAHVAKHGDPQQQKTPEGMQGLMKAFQDAKDEFAKPEHGLQDPKQQLRAAQFAISPAKKDLDPKDIAGAILKAPPLKDDNGKQLNNTQFGQVAMAHKAHEGVMAALKSATEGMKQAADAGQEASKEQKAHANMGPRPGGRH